MPCLPVESRSSAVAGTPKVSRPRVVDVRYLASYCMFVARFTDFPSHHFLSPAAYVPQRVNAGGMAPAACGDAAESDETHPGD